MIILLYGPDDYRREGKCRDIVAEFQKKHSGLGVEHFDMRVEGSLDALRAFLRNQSIFEPKKLAVIEGAFPTRGIAAAADDDAAAEIPEPEEAPAGAGSDLTALLKEHAENKEATIIVSEKKKPTKTFAFLLKKAALVQEFESLSGPAWLSFAVAEAKKRMLQISPAALKFLVAVHEGDSWGFATELDKLASWKPVIDMADLDSFDLDIAPNYWGLMNGLKSYDVRARLAALETLLALNDPPPKIFNILAASWREKMPQFAAYDRAIKSGKLDYEEALVDIALG